MIYHGEPKVNKKLFLKKKIIKNLEKFRIKIKNLILIYFIEFGFKLGKFYVNS
jgi:hypothetical protein